jgi:heme/copper-type cytochrome/quinol oxidase subunit 2
MLFLNPIAEEVANMSKVFVIKKKQIQLAIAVVALIAVCIVFLSWRGGGSQEVAGQANEPRVFELVTGEFKSEAADGKVTEVYLWAPGTIVVNKGELTQLKIHGTSGDTHPFVIEDFGISGEVQNGKVTTITFTPDKKGIFPIQCMTHTDMQNSGPMVGYIVVQ